LFNSLFIKRFVLRLFLLIIFYTFCRILFYFYNHNAFRDVDFYDFLVGVRFDIASIFLINLPLFIASNLPFTFSEKKVYKIVVSTLFILINSTAFAFNIADIAYFAFNKKRSTAELFNIIINKNDFWQLLPSYLFDYWYYFLLLFTIVFIFIYSEIKINNLSQKRPSTLSEKIIIFLIICGVCLIGARGGIQYIPLHIMHASKYTTAAKTALVLNTPFTLIKSFGNKELRALNYFNEKELNQYVNTNKQYNFNEKFLPLNVVIIIMESFSKEYIGSLSGKTSYTPFLDSLIKEGYVFKNAFANAQKSIDGIPAIVSGIPLMMDNSYITSPYFTNSTQTLAHILKEEGYSSYFYHGGTTGTMGFDAYAKSAGFDYYYGKENYTGSKKDDDGNWGIYDEPYFFYTVDELNKKPQPFLSVLFSLSSHHPYKIPKEFEDKFSEGTLPFHKSIQYADYALKQFFVKASKQSWFNNTLFVITADHTSLAEEGFYRNSVGMFQIPILYYSPILKLKGENIATTQQIDITASILHLLSYPKTFFSFGNNAFDSTQYHYAVNYYNGIYQLNDDSIHLQFNGEEFIGMYRYKEDSLLRNNLIKIEKIPEKAENTLKAFIQIYHQKMISNQLTPNLNEN
jgi:phosphoglycerol transferase MdoB-like AlkP superfamily enzyme